MFYRCTNETNTGIRGDYSIDCNHMTKFKLICLQKLSYQTNTCFRIACQKYRGRHSTPKTPTHCYPPSLFLTLSHTQLHTCQDSSSLCTWTLHSSPRSDHPRRSPERERGGQSGRNPPLSLFIIFSSPTPHHHPPHPRPFSPVRSWTCSFLVAKEEEIELREWTRRYLQRYCALSVSSCLCVWLCCYKLIAIFGPAGVINCHVQCWIRVAPEVLVSLKWIILSPRAPCCARACLSVTGFFCLYIRHRALWSAVWIGTGAPAGIALWKQLFVFFFLNSCTCL